MDTVGLVAMCPTHDRPLHPEGDGRLRCARWKCTYAPTDPCLTWRSAPGVQRPVLGGRPIELLLGADRFEAVTAAANAAGVTRAQWIRAAATHHLDRPGGVVSAPPRREVIGGPPLGGLLLGEELLTRVDVAARGSRRNRSQWLREAIDAYLRLDLRPCLAGSAEQDVRAPDELHSEQ